MIDANDRDRKKESKEIFGERPQVVSNDCEINRQFPFSDKMIKNELLSGVPLLILANKQDLPDCMGVREIKPVFQESGKCTKHLNFQSTNLNFINFFRSSHREEGLLNNSNISTYG